MNFWIILRHLFEIVPRMLKHRGNHQLVSSGFVFRIHHAFCAGQSQYGKAWTQLCTGSLQQERLWEVSECQEAFYSTTPERRKKKSKLTYDQSHLHFGTDHLEKQWFNVNYHLCSFPSPLTKELFGCHSTLKQNTVFAEIYSGHARCQVKVF